MKTIICPVDFSPCAENAVRYADELARCMNARIVLFNSIFSLTSPELLPYGGVPYVPPMKDTGYEEEQKTKLAALANRLRNQHPDASTSYETILKYGPAKNTLAELVREVHADLVVMGTEGASGWKEILEGSVAADVIGEVTCPVLIIPQRVQFKPFQRIVFATDLEGEPYAEMNFVLKLAELFDAELFFLHLMEKAREGAKAWNGLNKLHKAISYENVSFFNNTDPDIEAGIQSFVHQQKADLLVMANHPQRGWRHLFSEDHTQEMAFHTHLPLLVIHYN